MTVDGTSVEAAFAELRDAVVDLVNRGRQPLIQGVKPALQRRTGRAFDERALGFHSFREFVEAAAAEGFVSIRRTQHGPRIEPPTRLLASPTGRPRIRPDLWAAFTGWSGGRRWVWDPARTRAISAAPGDDIPGGIEITPSDAATHVQWAREFLGDNSDAKSAEGLLLVLNNSDAPYEQFSRLIRADSRLDGEWRGFRRRKVVDAIKKWAEENQVSVDPFGPADLPEPARPEPVEDQLEPLRTLAREAIEHMSASELHDLRLPLGAVAHLLR